MSERKNDDEVANDAVVVRTLKAGDLDAIVKIDALLGGFARQDFFKQRVRRSLEDSSVHLSLTAEQGGVVVGFVTVTFFYGEFGLPEPVAVLDAIGVHPEFKGQGVARALMRQLESNLAALRVETMRTEVDWKQFELLAYFANAGFVPAQRLCLERRLGAAR